MQRLTSVTVFGVLNIVFGVLGAAGLALSIVFLLAFPNIGEQPALPAAPDAWLRVTIAWGGLGTIWLITSGVGLLRMRRWGRVAAVWYAVVGTAMIGLNLVVHWIYVVQPAFAPADGPRPEVAIAAVGGLLGGVVGVIYPLLLWFFMSRSHVVAAFEGLPAAAVETQWAESVPPAETPDDTSNPYLAPRTDAVPRDPHHAPGAGESIVEVFVPSKNGPALAGYYLGLLSLLPCLGFPIGVAAVYFGLQGLRRVRQNPAVRGGAHAWVGVICGSLFGLFNFALLALLIIGTVAGP